MNGVDGLAESIKAGMKRAKKQSEQKALRGVIQGGRVHIGAHSYPMKAAVDVNTDDGSLVWVQLAKSGTDVIVGA